MITALQTPQAGAIMLDANNTVIKIQSSNGEGFYYRAFIYIDNALFDEQGWSRTDAYTAEHDLKKLYNAYFSPVFLSTFTNLLQAQTHLIKQVQVVVKEYALSTGAEVQSITLPAFFMMYNIVPASFSFSSPLHLLGFDDVTMVVPVDGKIAFAFYVGPTAQNLSLTLTTDQGSVLDSKGISIAKGGIVYLYQFDLAPVGLSYNVLYVMANIQVNGTSILRRTFRINRLPDYPVKEIAFQNNFGFYMYAYPDGEMQLSNGLTVETYTLQDDTEKVYEINQEDTYTINSGSLKAKERGIINMVATSPDTRLKNGAEWVTVVTGTKKILAHKDRQHQFDEALVFTRARGTDIDNGSYIYNTPQLPNIEFTALDNNGSGHLVFHYKFNNGFTPQELRVKYKYISAASYSTLLIFAATAPTGTVNINTSLSPGVWYFYLEEYGNPSNMSNVRTTPIS